MVMVLIRSYTQNVTEQSIEFTSVMQKEHEKFRDEHTIHFRFIEFHNVVLLFKVVVSPVVTSWQQMSCEAVSFAEIKLYIIYCFFQNVAFLIKT